MYDAGTCLPKHSKQPNNTETNRVVCDDFAVVILTHTLTHNHNCVRTYFSRRVQMRVRLLYYNL